jgi:methionyl-tRNA synthetase
MAEACRILGHLMAPFTPSSSSTLLEQLGMPAPYDGRAEGGPGLDAVLRWGGGPHAERRTGQPVPLFPRTELAEAAS